MRFWAGTPQGSANITQSELNTGPMQFSGTPTYMAQELFLKKGYDEKVDIFAFGTLMYELYSG